MQNYGEELAYWYFRFNGFFIISDFVLHRDLNKSPYEVDILAIRFPHVIEKIGGTNVQYDDNLLSHFQDNRIIGIICEVKTGEGSAKQINDEQRLSQALGRFGFIENYQDYISYAQQNEVISIEDKYEIGKIFIADRSSQQPNCINIPLSDIASFIKNRIIQYRGQKFQDRTHFPSSLLQYIIWEEHTEE